MSKVPFLIPIVILLLLSVPFCLAAYDLNVARTICKVGQQRGVSDRVMLAAFETAIVESGVRNLNYGDRDSLGVFQQRPSQGWGTREQVTNVEYAAGKFFDVARTRDICGPSAGQLAQCVQRSGFPSRYDENEGNARNLIAQIRCNGGGNIGGGGVNRGEQPCASVGHCFNRDSEQCRDGHPEGKVNRQFACPSQPDNVVCCIKNAGSSAVRNEQPCASVGHCYNRDTEQCADGHPEGKVNGQFACPTQPDNVVCCVKNTGSSGVKNEHPCSSVGRCYDRNTYSCPENRQALKVGNDWACPSQPYNVICCKNEPSGSSKPAATAGIVPNEFPCSSQGFCFDQETHSCPSGRTGGKVNGQFSCPSSQKDSVICCFH